MFGGSPAIPIPGPRPIDFAPDADIVASQSNLRVISQTLLLYSNENRGRLPPDLGTLFTTQTISPEVFLNPRGETPPPPPGMTAEETAAWINAHSDYIMLGAGQSSARVGPVLAYEDPSEMAGGINILFADGRVEFREMRWALETLARAGVL